MDLESIVLSEINQTKTNTIYHLYVKSKKIQQTSEYNKKKSKQMHRYGEQTSEDQWGEGRGKG